MSARPDISEYGSVDPAPPATEKSLIKLKKSLGNEDERMFNRMRAVFALRGLATAEAAQAICVAFNSKSALLRHEAAYVLGQMQRVEVVPQLIIILENEEEHVMVRHEAAEALGAIGDERALPTLKKFLTHQYPEISESCEVALDLFEHINKGSD